MKKLNQKGFSIIEVLIVLAIAGLIMLIVFLAVPALQRSARNNGRQSDGSKLSAAITQCLSNNNGVINNCQTATQLGYSSGEYSQLTDNPVITAKGANDTVTNTTVATNTTLTQATWVFGAKCSGNIITSTNVSQREFAVLYETEGSGNPQACIGS